MTIFEIAFIVVAGFVMLVLSIDEMCG